MTGVKYKIAHKRADHEKWNITDAGQRKRLIKVLREFIEGLEQSGSAEKKDVITGPPSSKKTTSAKRKKKVSHSKTLEEVT